MNDNDPFEAELRRLRPATPPDAFQERLLRVVASPARPRRDAVAPAASPFAWLAFLFRPGTAGWIAASALGLLLAAAFLWHRPPPSARPVAPATAGAGFVPDSMTLSQEVLARYDGGIVQSPDGEVVRLVCYDRVNRVVLKDSRRGSVVERREPQREIVPVHLDVY